MYKDSITQNTLIQFVGRIISAGCAFLITIILARTLGSYYYGEYTKVISFVMLAYLFVDLGLNPLFIKLWSQNTQTITLFSKFLGLRIIVGCIVFAVSLFFSQIFGRFIPGFTPLVLAGIAIGSIALLSHALVTTFQAFFQFKLQYIDQVIATTIGSIVWLIGIFFFSLLDVNLDKMVLYSIAVFIIGMASSLFFLFIRARSYLGILFPVVDRSLNILLLKQSLPLAFLLIFNLVYSRLDIWVLTFFRTSQEIGQYSLAYKFFDFAIVPPTLYMNSLYPLLLRQKFEEQAETIKKTVLRLLISSALIGILFFSLAPLIVLIKNDYIQAVVLLRLLVLGLPLFFITSPIMWLFIVRGKQKLLVYIYGSGLLFNVIANFLFVPKYGAMSSAIITGLSEMIVLLAALLILRYKKSLWITKK